MLLFLFFFKACYLIPISVPLHLSKCLHSVYKSLFSSKIGKTLSSFTHRICTLLETLIKLTITKILYHTAVFPWACILLFHSSRVKSKATFSFLKLYYRKKCRCEIRNRISFNILLPTNRRCVSLFPHSCCFDSMLSHLIYHHFKFSLHKLMFSQARVTVLLSDTSSIIIK